MSDATGSEFRLPVVAGRRSSQSNADFERACLVHIERLQHGLGPYDSAMMATFCEAVRMVREYSDAMQVRTSPEAGCSAVDNRHGFVTPHRCCLPNGHAGPHKCGSASDNQAIACNFQWPNAAGQTPAAHKETV